ncbi:MAG: beta-ketoacyl synthase N-terminal-like domain-containing protein, partial [Brevinematales bacterium]
ILAPGGRYLEIAMTGLKSSGNLNLSKLVDNQTFYSLDLKRLFLTRPDLIGKYIGKMVEYLGNGMIRPTVGKIFELSRIKEAYKYLEDRKNIGKIVVKTGVNENSLKNLKTYDNSFLNSRDKNVIGNHESWEDIAVIGLSCRFPEAPGPDAFWQNIAEGKDSIKEIPAERWDIADFYDPDPRAKNKSYSKWGGFLDNIDKFDPLFFNMTGREAEQTDPQQRIFMQECWKALEDAGYANERISGSRSSVFVGTVGSDYLLRMQDEGFDLDAQSFWGNASSVLASRISYFLNLKGPSISIDTACSSSLVAVHLGCRSIISGESDLAIAGGVFITNTPQFYIACSKGAMLSGDGKCHTFDNGANGFVPGEGAGVIILKSLKNAIRDNDRIHAVIKGSGINQDGKTNGITAPSTLSQTELELEVYKRHNINPENIGYVEAHGTGTKLGDPIEIDALSNAFSKFTGKKQFCPVGSVKTNIGHCATAAGIASVIKVIMALKNRKIPPSLNYNIPNEHINFEDSPFYVNTVLKDWPAESDRSRKAAVSSFGFSGTNAHIVFEEAREIQEEEGRNKYPRNILLFSAKNETALFEIIQNLLNFLKNNPDFGNINGLCYTYNSRKMKFNCRGHILFGDTDSLKKELGHILLKENRGNFAISDLSTGKTRIDPALLELGRSAMKDLLSLMDEPDLFNGKLLFLADLYCKGYELNWQDLYAQERPVTIPVYPFAQDKCWFETKIKNDDKIKKLQPFLDKNISGLSEVLFVKIIKPEEEHVAGNKLNGLDYIPGMALIEMALEACREINITMPEIKKIAWNRQVSLNEGKCEILASLIDEGDNINCEISQSSGGGSILISRLDIGLKPGLMPRAAKIDIGLISGAGAKVITKSEFYAGLEKKNNNYSGDFKIIEEFIENGDEALCRISLKNKQNIEDYILLPEVLESGIQAIKYLKDSDCPEDVNEIRALNIYGKLPESFLSFVKKQSDSKYRICLLDNEGEIIADMSGVSTLGIKKENTCDEKRTYYLCDKIWKEKSPIRDKNITFDNIIITVSPESLNAGRSLKAALGSGSVHLLELNGSP